MVKRKASSNGPDFSDIDSREKAEQLAARGELAKLFLLPPEFGGDDATPNIVHAPPFVVDIKNGIDTNTIGPLVSEGKVTRYTATPKYQGKSLYQMPWRFVLMIRLTLGPIKIWGEALIDEA